MSSALGALLHEFYDLQIVKYVIVASSAIHFYDYFITFDEEAKLIWPSRWGVPKVLFFLNRYMPFIDSVLLPYSLLHGGSASSCRSYILANGYLASYGILTAECILAMRTWALWGRARMITVILSILLLIDFTLIPVINTLYFKEVIAGTLPGLAGCLYTFGNRIVFGNFLLVIVNETVMVMLLIYKARSRGRESRTGPLKIMYQDGILYFIVILLTSIANLLASRIAPIEMNIFLILLQRVLHSACCTRVLIHIRLAFLKGSQQDDSEDSTVQPFTSIFNRTAEPSFNRDEYSAPDHPHHHHLHLPNARSGPQDDTLLSTGTVVYLPYGTVDSGSTGDTIELKSMSIRKKEDDSSRVNSPLSDVVSFDSSRLV